MSFFRRPSLRELLEAVQAEFGGLLLPAGGRAAALQIPHREWLLTLTEFTPLEGYQPEWLLRAPFIDLNDLRMEITVRRPPGPDSFRQGSGLAGTPGDLGPYRLRARHPQAVLRVMDCPALKALLGAGNCSAAIADGRRMQSGYLPAGVSQIWIQLPTGGQGPGNAVRLGRAMLDRIWEVEWGPLTEIERVKRILMAPAGRISDGELMLWDLDLVRLTAARSLGRVRDPQLYSCVIHLLESSEPALLKWTIEALASLDQPAAIPRLLILVARTAGEPDPDQIDLAARRAIVALGGEERLAALDAALEGDHLPCLSLLRLEQRLEIIEAMREVVRRRDGAALTGCALVLAELGVKRAAPDLRAALRRMKGRKIETSSLEAALRLLNSRSALPLPSAAASDPYDLPRASQESRPPET